MITLIETLILIEETISYLQQQNVISHRRDHVQARSGLK